ncbi:MAG: hypothetical protein IT267_05985 [Saprospiraceae bacterium]|nr:hypothetical protein [Saprospiraceae bacterium]
MKITVSSLLLIILTIGFYSCNVKKESKPPEWVKTLSVYEIMPKNFSPTQNIKGIIESLTKIRTIYCNAIALVPMTPNDKINITFNPNDPYASLDFASLDPSLGTEADLKELIIQAHQNRLKVFFEFEISYTGANHLWRKNNKEYYLSSDIKTENGLYNKDYIKLNFSNKKVRRNILNALKKWKSKYKPDGIIILNTQDLPSDFNQELVNQLKSDDFFLASGSEAPIKREEYIFDSYFNQNLYKVLKKISTDEARSSDFKPILEFNNQLKYKNSLIQFTRTAKINETEEAETMMFQHYYKFPALLSIATGGIPWILNGQEEPMFIKIDVNKPSFVERNYQYCLEFYRSLFIHRKENGALYSMEENSPEIISDSEDVLAFERKIGSATLVVLANLRASNSTFRINKSYNQYMEFFTRNKVDFVPSVDYQLGPHQYIVLTNKY